MGEKRGSTSGVPFTREEPVAHQAGLCGRHPGRSADGAVGCGAGGSQGRGITVAHDLDTSLPGSCGATLHPPGMKVPVSR